MSGNYGKLGSRIHARSRFNMLNVLPVYFCWHEVKKLTLFMSEILFSASWSWVPIASSSCEISFLCEASEIAESEEKC